MDLKKKLAELVEEYLNIVGDNQQRYMENSVKRILFIVIDDIDLNLDQDFDILENIHRYMMIPNVVVLVAADFPQLLNLCRKHFINIYDPKVNLTKVELDENADLAKDYLDKLLPIPKRIYI